MNTTSENRRPIALSSALLWASAFVIVGLIIVQAGRAGAGVRSRDAAIAAAPSYLDVVSRVGDYTMLSLNAGSDDVMTVLDGRGEEIYFYRIKNMKEFEFLGRDDLKNMFATAKRIGSGRK